MSQMLRRLLTAITVAAALVPASTITTGTAEAAASGCRDILFVGARGSGEPGPGTPGWKPTADDPHGLGGPVLSAYSRFVGHLGGTLTVAVQSVNYPATRVQSLYRNTDKFFNGLSEGVNKADSVIRRQAVKCPDQRLVVAGYSQGAMVMHRLIHRYRNSPSGKDILRRLNAAVLIGDGDRVRGDTTMDAGTMHARLQGIGHVFPSQSGSSGSRFPAALGARIFEVCNANDPVCDSTGVLGDLVFLRVHFQYPKSMALRQAVQDAAARLLISPGGSVSSLQTVGSAVAMAGQATLTKAGHHGVAGAIWSSQPVPVDSGFIADAELTVSPAAAPGSSRGDGIAFVVQDDQRGSAALGDAGGDMGYGGTPCSPDRRPGISHSIAIEFDTYQNVVGDCPAEISDDPNANHVSVQSRGTLPNSGDAYYSLGTVKKSLPNLGDATPHTLQIVYLPGNLTVWVDRHAVLSVAMSLPGLIGLTSGQATVGFTAATGTFTDTHRVMNFKFRSVAS